MIKIFRFKDMELKVKTTMMKEGVCYFGEKDVVGEFERAYKEAQYKAADQKSTEQIVLNVYKELKNSNIVPDSIKYRNITYYGIKMTEFVEKNEE